MEIAKIIESTIAGLLTTSVWALALFLYNISRNIYLEKQLKRVIVPNGAWITDDGFGIPVFNQTNTTVTLRDIYLHTTTNTFIQLKYFGPVNGEYFYKFPFADPSEDVLTLMPLNEETKKQPTEHGFAILPPKTACLWGIEDKKVNDFTWQFDKCILIFEYKTLFNTSKLVEVEADEGIINLIQDIFDEYCSELSG